MLKDYLRQKRVEFKEINVAQDGAWAKKMVEKSGQMGVPQLWINGQVVVGFNRPRLETLIEP
ncbi:NrdH-redoxin [Patescibacteria group bacterium]|nr:NrdH-redoxin [Patescibacteria group bacterium]MCL5091331.1 NrdH-redoxin [Patescibacteria group bacterium]